MLQEKEGEEKLQERAKAAKLDAVQLFEADPEIDIDLPSVSDFLKAEGLQSIMALTAWPGRLFQHVMTT